MDLELLRKMLNEPDVSIKDISDVTGISRVSIYGIKKGNQIPSERNFMKLCKYFSDSCKSEIDTNLISLAKNVQEEIIKSGKDITIIVSPKIIGKLKDFKII